MGQTPKTLEQQLAEFLSNEPHLAGITVTRTGESLTFAENVSGHNPDAYFDAIQDSLIRNSFTDCESNPDADEDGFYCRFTMAIPASIAQSVANDCRECNGTCEIAVDGICEGCACYPAGVSYQCECRQPATVQCEPCSWLLNAPEIAASAEVA